MISTGGARRDFGRGVLGSLAAIGVCAAANVGTVAPAGAEVTGLSVQATGAARYVPATDGRVHIEYDLLTANALPTDATLKSLVDEPVRGLFSSSREALSHESPNR